MRVDSAPEHGDLRVGKGGLDSWARAALARLLERIQQSSTGSSVLSGQARVGDPDPKSLTRRDGSSSSFASYQKVRLEHFSQFKGSDADVSFVKQRLSQGAVEEFFFAPALGLPPFRYFSDKPDALKEGRLLLSVLVDRCDNSAVGLVIRPRNGIQIGAPVVIPLGDGKSSTAAFEALLVILDDPSKILLVPGKIMEFLQGKKEE